MWKLSRILAPSLRGRKKLHEKQSATAADLLQCLSKNTDISPSFLTFLQLDQTFCFPHPTAVLTPLSHLLISFLLNFFASKKRDFLSSYYVRSRFIQISGSSHIKYHILVLIPMRSISDFIFRFWLRASHEPTPAVELFPSSGHPHPKSYPSHSC